MQAIYQIIIKVPSQTGQKALPVFAGEQVKKWM